MRKLSSGGLKKNYQYYLFFASIHSLLIRIFRLEPDLFFPTLLINFIFLGLIGWYRPQYFMWVWAPNIRVLTILK